MVTKRIYQALINKSDIFLILMFPILLSLLNSNWIFSPSTDFLPDAWFYLGYFRYFDKYVSTFPSNVHYFVERITWNVPGYYIYKFLPPLIANYFIHLTVCYLALLSLYGTLSMMFNRRTAMLTTLIMSGYPWFLRSVGWDYVDGVGISLMLFLIYLLVASKIKYPHLWRYLMILAGITHASLLTTNLFWLGFAPAWVVFYIYINRPLSKEKSLKLFGEAIYFTIGNIVISLAAALYYYSVSGNFNFLQNSLAYSSTLSQDNNLIGLIYVFYGGMPPLWHVLPILVSVGSLVLMKRLVKDKNYNFFMATCLLFIVSYGWLVFWHLYALPYLIVFLYSSFIIPSTFLLLGALLSHVVDDLPQKVYSITIGVMLTILATPFFLVVMFPILENWQGNPPLLLFFCLSFLITLFFSRNKSAVQWALISLSVIPFLTGSNSYVMLPNQSAGRDKFMAIISSSNAIDAYYPNHEYLDFRLWYREDIHYDVFFNLSALYLYPWGSAISEPFSAKKPTHTFSTSERDKFNPGDNIVILSSNPNPKEVMAEANRALHSQSLILILDASKEIQEGSIRFTLYFTQVVSINNE